MCIYLYTIQFSVFYIREYFLRGLGTIDSLPPPSSLSPLRVLVQYQVLVFNYYSFHHLKQVMSQNGHELHSGDRTKLGPGRPTKGYLPAC
jgi:hypothetical protein